MGAFSESWQNNLFGYRNQTLSSSCYSIAEPIDVVLELMQVTPTTLGVLLHLILICGWAKPSTDQKLSVRIGEKAVQHLRHQ